MKVLERATMPDGTKIQIEDWTEDYTCFDTLSIAAYPRSERLPRSRKSWVVPGEEFRVSIDKFKRNKDTEQAFEALRNGTKAVKDFADYFWDPWHIEML